MSDRESALHALAELLRGEDTPISPYVVDPGEVDAAAVPPAYDLLFEQVREGYLLHYEDARVLAGQDEDLALLAGDYLYALGLARLAALGDDRSVLVLADLISNCAQLYAEDRRGEVPALWREAAAAVTARS